MRSHSVGVWWANTKRKAISSGTLDHLPTKQDPRSHYNSAIAFRRVGWANHDSLAISS
ncbi:MAG: hypothetical protein F6K44_01585 [Moorea sp. SIO3E2]|uniref:hypothetical protein n=1 Tax=Moorena sp. SIO4E2 TaxID=2607826 RepID=UPI0013BDAA56|nr:hypothetical protein [Moorena sp. SIO4E2]NEQ07986.1 hypothetical protein [Moorena sp. SIO4E2]NEQ12629.1 hypothetical protein [Moorena sp. SIO3E2]